MHTTNEGREGYIMISDARSRPPPTALLTAAAGCLRAMGLRGSLAFARAVKGGGPSLSERLAREKRDFIRVEMVAVPGPHQGQGHLRTLLDIAFEMGRERGLPCILDTDGREKMERYRHLGMKLAGVRQVGERSWLYDLIWTPEGYERSDSR